MNKEQLLYLAQQYHSGLTSAVFQPSTNSVSFLDANGIVMFVVTIGIEAPIFHRLNSTQNVGSGFMAELQNGYHEKFPLIAHMATRGNVKLFSSYDSFKLWVADFINFCNMTVFNDCVTIKLDRDPAVQYGMENPDCIIKRHMCDF